MLYDRIKLVNEKMIKRSRRASRPEDVVIELDA